jgi:Mce-associated membrane protein
VEDQPTDTSDLTDTGPATKEPAASGGEKPSASRGAVPVGKRGGRHRSFRPRPVVTTPAVPREPEGPPADVVVAEPADVEAATVESPTGEAETPISEHSAEAAVAEPAPKAKRRWWFRERSAATSAEPTSETESPEEPIAPGDIADSADVEEFPAEEPGETAEAADSTAESALRKPVGRKPVGRRMAIAVAVAATLFVAAGAFGGAMLQPYLADRAAANTKLEIARTATAAITTLFTYTPDDMDQLPARSAKYLGGDLKDSYGKQVDALAATNKQNQIHRSAQVVGAAVESLNGPTATAVVYANVTYTSAATKDVPKMFLVSYRLTMQRKGSDWLITNMPWITSKDLTRVTP